MSRFALFIVGAVVLLIVAGLVMSGAVSIAPDVSTWAPWVGFGGALLLFILAIRSRRS